MKWFTCTPVAFGGGEDFFARDSGLLSRGFREIGVESRAVMPGVRREGDLKELIRTEYANLESGEWWRAHGLDGVVLYAWGSPRFRRVAKAIREAGVRLVLNQDSGGLVSPRCGLREWLQEQRILSGAGRVPWGRARQVAMVVRGLSLGVLVTDPLRSRHLREGDRITAVSPVAAERYRRLGSSYLGGEPSERVMFLPHPVEASCRYEGEVKRNRVVVVGRWTDPLQKRPEWLMRVVERLLDTSAAEFDIIGECGTGMRRWHGKLGEANQWRVVLHGRMSRTELTVRMKSARVSYCPSAFESFHIASAEALCCGATVVAGRSPSMASFEWFTGEGDGVLAEECVEAHAAAVEKELSAWEAGGREPAEISSRWSARLHAPQVARGVLDLFGVQDLSQ